jgi:cellulose biosynthesis protein BcsQ
VLGVVVSDVDTRTRLARLHIDLIEDLFRRGPGQRSAMFETIISRSTVIGEAQRLGKTIFQTDPSHKVTEQYRQLASELEQRLAAFAVMPLESPEVQPPVDQREGARAHG